MTTRLAGIPLGLVTIAGLLGLATSLVVVEGARAQGGAPLRQSAPPRSPIAPPTSQPSPLIHGPAGIAAQGAHLDKLTMAEFKALPGDARVVYKGQRMSKEQFLQMEADKLRAGLQTLQARLKAKARPRTTRTLQAQRRAGLDAKNAQARAELARLQASTSTPGTPSQRDALLKEAQDLIQKHETASPAEKVELERRAGELQQRLERFGR